MGNVTAIGIPSWTLWALLVLILTSVTIVMNIRFAQKMKQFTARRGAFQAEEFRNALAYDVPAFIMEEILGELRKMMGIAFPFKPSDKLLSDYEIDSEDLEDIVEMFADQHELNPGPKPLILPEDPSLGELLHYCNTLLDLPK